MSNETTMAPAVAAGFIGWTAWQRPAPAPVCAQDQPSETRRMRAHRFVPADARQTPLA